MIKFLKKICLIVDLKYSPGLALESTQDSAEVQRESNRGLRNLEEMDKVIRHLEGLLLDPRGVLICK